MTSAEQTWAEREFPGLAETMLARFPDDEPGKMLRSPGLRTGGKFYGFAHADQLTVKLPAPRVQELIEAGIGTECSPRPDHPMREWVQLPSPTSSEALAYLTEARTFVTPRS